MNGGLVVANRTTELGMERLDDLGVLMSPQSRWPVGAFADGLQEGGEIKRLGCGGRRDGGVWLSAGSHAVGATLVVLTLDRGRWKRGTNLAQVGELKVILQPIVQDLRFV